MLRIYQECVSQADMEQFIISSKKSLLTEFIMNPGNKMDIYVEPYRAILVAQRQVARGKLTQNSLSPDTAQPQE
jgi:hypothetical protein